MLIKIQWAYQKLQCDLKSQPQTSPTLSLRLEFQYQVQRWLQRWLSVVEMPDLSSNPCKAGSTPATPALP